MFTQLLAALAYASVSLAAPAPVPVVEVSANRPRTTFPFTKLIAFGDDFTDNGQGSWAHGITGDPATGNGKALWGANTWTDGLVPVSYLANSLNMTLKYDYAFGSAGGGAVIGSVCNISAVAPSQLGSYAKLLNNAVVPDALSQISNYTTTNVFDTRIKKTLHFFWTGNNDMIASLGWIGRFTICSADTLCVPAQQAFIAKLVACQTAGLTKLLDAGAEHIIVPNIFPRNLAPWTSQYISNTTGMIANFGSVIAGANSQLKSSVAGLQKKYPDAKIMYYDANGFLTRALSAPAMVGNARYGFTCVDGCGSQVPGGNWNIYWKNTVLGKQPDDFFWMTTVMPSTTVLKYLAADMMSFLQGQYA